MTFEPYEYYVTAAPELVTVIRQFRRALRIRQAEMADLLGMTQGWYSKVENGTPEVPCIPVMRLFHVLSQHPRWLEGTCDNKKETRRWFKQMKVQLEKRTERNQKLRTASTASLIN